MKNTKNTCFLDQKVHQLNPRAKVLQKITRKTSVIPGFTLVELIVVITILAILGTIGFLSIGGYSSRARDSARVGDTATIAKSLDISIITAGSYPDPDNYFSVTYSGGKAWNQGTIGSSVISYLKGTIQGGGLNKKPVDPLKNTEYTYSNLVYGKAYQVKTEYEGDLSTNAYNQQNSILDATYAAAGNPTIAYIRGNYGGLVLKTVTGSTICILAVPSIVTSTGATAGGTIDISFISGTLLFNGKPLASASSYNPNQSVACGTTFPTTDTDITTMITNLKLAYSGSDIVSNTNIANLLSSTGSTNIKNLGTSLITTQLGGTVSNTIGSVTPTPFTICTGTGQTGVATTTYPGCDTQDIIICTGAGVGQVWSACNVGATTAGTGTTSSGTLHQWGRNDGLWNWGATDWQATNSNSWGGGTTTTTVGTWATVGSSDQTLMQGPCGANYHVPTALEWRTARNTITAKTSGWVVADRDTIQNTLKLPMGGIRGYMDGVLVGEGTLGYYWSSTQFAGTYGFDLGLNASSVVGIPNDGQPKAFGYSIRCLKN